MPPAVGALAGALGPLPGPSGLPVPLPELGGRWRKDRARSDSMDPMCEVRSSSPFPLPSPSDSHPPDRPAARSLQALEMGFAFRQAANLLRTVEIVQVRARNGGRLFPGVG